MPTPPTAPFRRSSDTESSHQRHVLGVFAVGGVGAGVFVLATLASLAGHLGAAQYLLSTGVSVVLVVAAVTLGHLKLSAAASRS